MASRWVFSLALLLLIGCREERPPATPAPASSTAAPVAEPARIEPAVKAVPRAPVAAPLPPITPGVPREAMRYQRELIGNARSVWGLNAPVATFAGQVHQESTWKAEARSRTGAAGLAQFMPKTSDWISGLYSGELGENEPLNPTWALRALARYDKHLYDRVQPFETICDRMLFALSDYNGGSGWRIKRQKKSPRPGSFDETGVINPGITPGNQRENQEYPHRIVDRWQPLYLSWGPGVCT